MQWTSFGYVQPYCIDVDLVEITFFAWFPPRSATLSAPVLSLFVRETSASSPSLTLESCISIASGARASVIATETRERLTAPGYLSRNYHSDSDSVFVQVRR